MKLYIVFWWNSFAEKWAVDSVHKSYEVAEAKMRYEWMENPTRPYFLDEVDAPDGLSWAADKEASADKVAQRAKTAVGQR